MNPLLTPELPSHEPALEPTRRPPRRKLTGLSELLERRTDLRGTYAPADYLAEAVRWSA